MDARVEAKEMTVPSPLQPGDHYILHKLCDELLPWMISGRKVGRQWFVRVAAFYGYSGDLAAALAGLGIGAPAVAIVQGELPAGQNALDVLRTVLPSQWFVVGIIGAIAWVILRLVIRREDVVTRALLAREYARSINALYAQLWQALAAADPMPQILIIQRSVDDRVQDAIKNGVWPWDPPPPPLDKIEKDLKEMIDRIRSTFMTKWAPPPQGAV